jgi:aminopeptidase N
MSGAPPTFADDTASAPAFRLPTTAAPVRYRLDLRLIPDQDTFTGAVEIDLNFTQATSILWLNADKLEIKQARIIVGGQPVGVKVVATPKDYAGFSFDHSVGPGPATLHATFEGKIDRKDMQGIFQVKDGDYWYVYSQFENIGA